jgi:class 3 adenylate cyclase/predicted ATPase
VSNLIAKNSVSSLISSVVNVSGTFVFMDISGFTTLSETLSKYGKEGTEVLTINISNYFEKTLFTFFEYGGDVVKFGGDALTILFQKHKNESDYENIERACFASIKALDSIQGYIAKTPFGEFELKAKIGISYGESFFTILGREGLRLEYIFSGAPVDISAEAEHNAKPSEIILDKNTFLKIENQCKSEKINENFVKLKYLYKTPTFIEEVEEMEIADQIIKDFLIPSVYRQIKEGSEKFLSEHRPVTSCFVSFPAIDLKDDEKRNYLQKYFLDVIELLIGFGGSFNRMDMGDKGSKFLCFFGAPETYADNEERAVSFALELKKIEKELKDFKGQSIGISSGVAYCGIVGSPIRKEYTVMGDIVNVSARLMTAANGKVLVTESVRERTRRKFKYTPKKELSLKGKSVKISVSTPIRHLLLKSILFEKTSKIFSGRKSEIQQLANLLKHSENEIVLSGEAGIGKTELVRQLVQKSILNHFNFNFIYPPLSSENSYFVSQTVLKTVLSKIHINSIPDENLRNFLPEKSDFLPLFNVLFGKEIPENSEIKSLSSEQKIETLSEVFSLLLDKISFSLKEKEVFVIEDFDRVSKEEEKFLSKVFERLAFKNLKFLILSRDSKKITQKTRIMVLEKLSKKEVEEYAIQFNKSTSVPKSLVDFLYERSFGNPLYLCEIISVLKERKVVTLSRENFVIFKPEEAVTFSKSIEEILLTRLDSLTNIEKNLLKVASCFGENFEVDKLSKIFVPHLNEDEIRNSLLRISYLGVEKIAPNEFRFSNKLLRDVAYDSILVSNKREIHKQIAEIIESQGVPTEKSEILSYHYGLAEQHLKAYEYALISARKAFSGQFYFKAQQFYGLAIEQGKKVGIELEESELLNYLKSLIFTGEREKAEGLIERLKKSENSGVSLNAQFYYITLLDQSGEYQKEYEEATKLNETAREKSNSEIVVSTIKYAISALIRLGKYDEALKFVEIGFKSLLENNIEEELPHFYILMASALYAKGEYLKAKEYYLTAKSYGETLKNYELLLRSFFGLANCFLALNHIEEALNYAKDGYDLSKKLGSRMNIVGAATTIAWCLIQQENVVKALEILKESVSLVDELNSPYAAMPFFNQLGVAYFLNKNYKHSLKYFRKSYRLATIYANKQILIITIYNVSEVFKEIGDKRRTKKELEKLIKSHFSSMDLNFLKKVAKEFFELSESDEEKRKAEKLLLKTAKSIGKEDLFNEILK